MGLVVEEQVRMMRLLVLLKRQWRTWLAIQMLWDMTDDASTQ